MKTQWLFPHRFRLIGWIIFVPFLILGLVSYYGNGNNFTNETATAKFMRNNDVLLHYFQWEYLDELASIGIIIGLLFIAFSREKVEDEMISQLRFEALQWSVYVNYMVLMIAILMVYDVEFINVMIYNMFTILIVFIARFRWSIYRLNQSAVL